MFKANHSTQSQPDRDLAGLTIDPDCTSQKVVARLERDGVVSMPGYFNPELLPDLREDARRLLAKNSLGTVERDYHCGQSVAVDRSLWDPAQYRALASAVDTPHMRAVAAGFLGPRHHFNHHFFVTKETVAELPITGLHFDRLPTLKFFIYLFDTDKASGALECIPGSHRMVREIRRYHLQRGVRIVDLPNFCAPASLGDPVAMEGIAGTMIVFTTDVFHRGGVVAKGRQRWVVRGHTRLDPLPAYKPRSFFSAQWWRESPMNPKRYWYKAADGILGRTPPHF